MTDNSANPGWDIDGVCNDHGVFACQRCAPERSAANGNIVEAIALFVEAWNGETADGHTGMIAGEIRERFAAEPGDDVRVLLREAKEHGLLHVSNADPEAREKYNDLLARIDTALSQADEQPDTQNAYTKRRIGEIIDEGDGFWEACSGCQESSDGCVSAKDYPYSDVFRCQPGSGCSECGGIGVIWDDTDYEEYAKFMLDQEQPDTDDLRRIAERLAGQRDEPDAFTASYDRVHYWRDKAIKAAAELRALAEDRKTA